MALAPSESLHRIPPFKHVALDHAQASIRIMKVLLDLSPEGLVQCSLKHGSTADDYTCLSYTWGNNDTACPIIMEGRLFFVRQNLHDFLHVVRKRYPLRPFWIDAVCIDQSSIAERNHQVAQMGAIYSAAVHVIIWLGNSSPIAVFFRAWNRFCRIKKDFFSPPQECSFWQMTAQSGLWDVREGWVALADHPYWTRAWITQEIAHSRALSLLAEMVETHNVHDISNPGNSVAATPYNRFAVHIDIAHHRHTILEKPLFSLLEKLPKQECQRARDRVYSLLGLAAEGANIGVDYGSSNMAFVLMLLNACRELRCLCGLMFISNILNGTETLTTSTSEKVHLVTLTLKADSAFVMPKRGLQLSSIMQEADSPLIGRRDTVLHFRLHKVCDIQPDTYGLEVLSLADQGTRQPVGRFTHPLSSEYHPRCLGRGSCKSKSCACHEDYMWWPAPDTHPEEYFHSDSKSEIWQPEIEDTHPEEMKWFIQPGSERIVSTWFELMLQIEEPERPGYYALDIPLSVCWWYAHQSRDFKGVVAKPSPDSYNIVRSHELDGWLPIRLCDKALSGRGAIQMERRTTLERSRTRGCTRMLTALSKGTNT